MACLVNIFQPLLAGIGKGLGYDADQIIAEQLLRPSSTMWKW